MKNMLESAEVFEAYARIDASYFCIQQIKKEMEKPVTGINALIDKATGFDKVSDKKHLSDIIEILENVVKDKKFIGADYAYDLEMLTECQKYIEKI